MLCLTAGKSLSLIIIGSVVLGLGGALFVFLPQILHNLITDAMVIKPPPPNAGGGGGGGMPEIKIYTHYYLFNYTNAKEWKEGWKDGVKPFVKQLGPYVYRKFSTEVNKTFQSWNRTVQTYSQSYAIFQPDLSTGKLDDVVVLPDVPLRGFAQRVPVEKATETLGLVNSGYFSIDGFMTATAGQLLYEGVFSDVLDALVMVGAMTDGSQTFSFFGSGNNSIGHSPFIMTGEDDIRNLGKVFAFGTDDEQRFNITQYLNSPCDQIEGVAGGQFHPGITKDDVLTVINEGLCRTLKFKYHGEGVHHDVGIYKFQPDVSLLGDANVNPDNACFCADNKNSCRPTGVYSMQPCIGAPMAMSWPHFLMADRKVKEAIDGLEPDFNKHGTQFEIFPLLGIPLKASIRIQTNLEITRIPWLPPLDYFPEIFLPLFWMSDGADLDEPTTKAISSKIHMMRMMGDLIPLGVLVLGGVIGIAGILCSVIVNFKISNKSEPAKSTPIKQAWVSHEY